MHKSSPQTQLHISQTDKTAKTLATASCLYRAVREVCLSQFGIDISDSLPVFDTYNTGDGVPIESVKECIDTALSPYGIEVEGIYGKATGLPGIQCVDFISAPCLAYIQSEQHIVPVTKLDRVTATVAFTLRRSPIL